MEHLPTWSREEQAKMTLAEKRQKAEDLLRMMDEEAERQLRGEEPRIDPQELFDRSQMFLGK